MFVLSWNPMAMEDKFQNFLKKNCPSFGCRTQITDDFRKNFGALQTMIVSVSGFRSCWPCLTWPSWQMGAWTQAMVDSASSYGSQKMISPSHPVPRNISGFLWAVLEYRISWEYHRHFHEIFRDSLEYDSWNQAMIRDKFVLLADIPSTHEQFSKRAHLDSFSWV